MKTILASVFLVLAPMGAFAACDGHQKQAMSCVDGQQYDAGVQRCVPTTS